MFPFTLTGDELRALHTSKQRQTLSPMAVVRLDCILHFLENGQSIAQTCKTFHISRGTLQRWIDRFDPADLQTLEERGGPTNQTTAVPDAAVALIREYRTKSTLLGKEVIAARLQSEHGITISPSTVGRVIESEGLYFGDTPLHWRKRMQYKQTHGMEVIAHARMTEEKTPDTTRCAPDKCASNGGCTLCSLKKQWPTLRRTFIVVSLVTNVFFFGALIAIAWYESNTANQPTTQATVIAPYPSRHK